VPLYPSGHVEQLASGSWRAKAYGEKEPDGLLAWLAERMQE
jgi:hypothetical protein